MSRSHSVGGVSEESGSDGGSVEHTGGSAGGRLARDLGVYTVARLGLVVAVTAVIVFGARLVSVEVPLIVAILFALIIGMPVSMVLLKGLRARVNEDISTVDQRRRRDKEQLRARLRGDDGDQGAE